MGTSWYPFCDLGRFWVRWWFRTLVGGRWCWKNEVGVVGLAELTDQKVKTVGTVETWKWPPWSAVENVMFKFTPISFIPVCECVGTP